MFKSIWKYIPVLAIAFVLAGCDHKTPTASDVSASLTQEMKGITPVSVKNVEISNEIPQQDGSVNVFATVTVAVKQPAGDFAFMSGGVKQYLATEEINVAKNNIVEKYAQQDVTVAHPDWEDQLNNAKVMLSEYQEMLNNYSPLCPDDQVACGDVVKAKAGIATYSALVQTLTAKVQNYENSIVAAKEKEYEAVANPIAVKYGFKNLDDLVQISQNAAPITNPTIPPAYFRYPAVQKTYGSIIAYESLLCFAPYTSPACTDSDYTGKYKLQVSMVKTSNGWQLSDATTNFTDTPSTLGQNPESIQIIVAQNE